MQALNTPHKKHTLAWCNRSEASLSFSSRIFCIWRHIISSSSPLFLLLQYPISSPSFLGYFLLFLGSVSIRDADLHDKNKQIMSIKIQYKQKKYRYKLVSQPCNIGKEKKTNEYQKREIQIYKFPEKPYVYGLNGIPLP